MSYIIEKVINQVSAHSATFNLRPGKQIVMSAG